MGEGGGFAGRHAVEAAAEDFGGEEAGVVFGAEDAEESGEVDDAFAGEEALEVADVFGREGGAVGEVDVEDAFGGELFEGGGAGAAVVPVPGVEQESGGGGDGEGEVEHFVEAGDEFVGVLTAEVEGGDTLEGEADGVLGEDFADRLEAAHVEGGLIGFGEFGGGREADGGEMAAE